MLTLALLRHAKSSWDDPAQEDFDRPLNERGLKAAPAAGAALVKLGIVPDLVLCSAAQRTRETLKHVMAAMALPTPPKTVIDEKLYLASPVTLLELIRDIPEGRSCVLLIGHNPGLHALALTLTGRGDPVARAAMAVRYPTAALAVLKIDRDRWSGVRASDATLEAFWTPKKGFGGADA